MTLVIGGKRGVDRRSALSALGSVLVAFAVYAAARLVVAQAVPWQRAFDDFFYLPETLRWLEAGRLGSDGVFLRVPVWNLLLGLHIGLFGVTTGLVLLQGQVVLGCTACAVAWARRVAPDVRLALWAPLLLFLLSPQVLLYSRQAVNELFIGLLTLVLLLLGESASETDAAPRWRATALGGVCGIAAMTKLSAALLAPVAIVYVLRGAPPVTRARALALARFGVGLAGVVVPLFLFAALQRDTWLLDNTSACNLSGMPLREWRALEDPATRQAAGLAHWRDTLVADPIAYAGGALARTFDWIVAPSSADFAYFYRAYPMAWLKRLDRLALVALTVLAVVGTRRRDLFLWWMAVGWTLACTLPLATPRSPKVILLFPALFLATRGVARIDAWLVASRQKGT